MTTHVHNAHMPPTDLNARADRVVTPALIDAFARDGAVCLSQLLNADEVARLRAGIDANIAAPRSPASRTTPASSSRIFATGKAMRPTAT